MNTNEVIKKLRELDPDEECEVFVGGVEERGLGGITHIERKGGIIYIYTGECSAETD